MLGGAGIASGFVFTVANGVALIIRVFSSSEFKGLARMEGIGWVIRRTNKRKRQAKVNDMIEAMF